jgi:glycosyltransferase involved in cell wall biosynthesis
VYWVTRAFTEKGHRVRVVAPFLHGRGIRHTFPSVELHSSGRFTRFVRFKEMAYAILMVRTFMHLLDRSAQVIYAHNVVAGLPAVLAGKIRKIPVVYDMDDLLTGYSKNPWVYRFGPKLEKWVARNVDVVIVPSEFGVSWCASWGAKRIEVIRHGADLERFRPRSKEGKTITFVGGLEPNDGVLLVPLAAESVLKRFPNTRFLFVGEGKALPNLKRLAKSLGVSDRFEFRDWVDQKHVPDILSESKIGLITSFKVSATVFSSPLRSYEYMAMGLPFVAPDLPGIREQVELSGAGLLFQPENPVSLSNMLVRLLSDNRLRERLSKNGRRYALKHADWEKAGTRIAEVCESMIEKSRVKGNS